METTLLDSTLSLFQHRMQYIWLAIQRNLAVDREYLYMMGDFQKGLELYLWLSKISNPMLSLTEMADHPTTSCKIFKRLSDRRVNMNFCLLQFVTMNKGKFMPLQSEIVCKDLNDLLERLNEWIVNEEEIHFAGGDSSEKHNRPKKKVSWSPQTPGLSATQIKEGPISPTGIQGPSGDRGKKRKDLKSSEGKGAKGIKGMFGIKSKSSHQSRPNGGLLQRSKSFDVKATDEITREIKSVLKRRKTDVIPSEIDVLKYLTQ